MVQIIQSQPTQRQSALMDAFGQFANNFGNQYLQGQQTLRQQALQDVNTNLKLQEMGIDATAQDLRDHAAGKYKEKEISPAIEDSFTNGQISSPADLKRQDEMGNVSQVLVPGKKAVMGNANPMLNYTAAKKAQMEQAQGDAELTRQAKQAGLEKIKAETADITAQSPYKSQKMQMEMQKLKDDTLMSPIARRKAEAEIAKINADATKTQREATVGNEIPGYRNVSGFKPTEKDIESLKSLAGSTKNILNAADSLKGSLKKYGVSSGMGFTEGGRIVDQDLTNLQVELKNMYELGALSGPDMGLVNNAIGKISGPGAIVMPGNDKKAAIEQVQRIADKAIKNLESKAQARGFEPLNKSTPMFESKEDQEAFKWASQNPNDPRAKDILSGLGV